VNPIGETRKLAACGKLWGSQSWLQPALSRRLRLRRLAHDAKKPPKRRLRAGLPAPQNRQNFGRTALDGVPRFGGALLSPRRSPWTKTQNAVSPIATVVLHLDASPCPPFSMPR
jgi:hypothetical protein